MKKGFRWISALVILVLTMLFSAAAMAESSGEEEKVRDTVEKLCSGIQNYDAQQISSCLKNPSSLTYVSEENAPYVNRFIRENNKQMFRYTVRELSVNGEKAAVVLEIRYPNACDIFQKAMDQLFLYSMSKPEVKTEKAVRKFGKYIKTYAQLVNIPVRSETVSLSLTKTGGEWKVGRMNKKMNLILNDGYPRAVQNFENSYDKE